MNQKELIAEHTMFLGVYRARISRARQVKKTYVEMLHPLAVELAKAEKAILNLEKEFENADDVVETYETKLDDTKKVISELERGGKVFKEHKKPSRLNKLMRLRRKLNELLEEDPELAQYLDNMEE